MVVPSMVSAGVSPVIAEISAAGMSTGVRDTSLPSASYTTTAGVGVETSTAALSLVMPTSRAAGDPVSISARAVCLYWSLSLSWVLGSVQLNTSRALAPSAVQCSTVANCWSATAASSNVHPTCLVLGLVGLGWSPYWMVR